VGRVPNKGIHFFNEHRHTRDVESLDDLGAGGVERVENSRIERTAASENGRRPYTAGEFFVAAECTSNGM